MSEKYIIPTPGDVIAGKYHIERELGRGAYGVVFRARQKGIDRHVALKTLLPKAFLETDVVERFEREAQFVGRLSHANIVGVHDYGRHENLLYMAVEYVEGDTLEQIIKREAPLAPDRTRRLVYQIIDALEHAHARGIVHRDLKPANIVIVPGEDDDGNPREVVKVLDFGIAKLIQSEADDAHYQTLTQAGTVLGTPHYMSPESIVGDEIDHRADIYSLGVIIHEMLTGERPFGAKNSPGVMVKHLRDEAPPLPAHLEHSCWGEAVGGCLAKRPEDRIDAAGEVHTILERRDEGDPADYPDATAASKKRHPRRSRGKASSQKTWTIAAVILGALMAVGIAFALQLVPSSDAPQPVAPGATAADKTGEDSPGPSAEPLPDVEPSPLVAAPASDEPAADGPTVDEPAADEGTTMRFDEGEDGAPPSSTETRDDPGQTDEAPPASTDHEPPARRKAVASADDAPPTEPVEPAARDDADDQAAGDTEDASQVALSLQTTPPKARVFVDGKPIGTTPLDYEVARGEQPVTFEFSHIGYRTKYRTVVPTRDQDLHVELQKGRLKLIP